MHLHRPESFDDVRHGASLRLARAMPDPFEPLQEWDRFNG